MRVTCSAKMMVLGAAALLVGAAPIVSAADTAISSGVTSLQTLPKAAEALEVPTLIEPAWLKEQRAAKVAAGQQATTVPVTTTVTYDVMTRGTITASLAEFRAQANATLNDGRGWSQLGVLFKEVSSGGMFTLALSSADQVPSFSPGCGAAYSCNAGRYVIINQDRWLGATAPWNDAGGSLRDYRHMVVNHETGHWLGHGHAFCGGTGQSAPVMQQQSIDLQGCKFNPWPTTNELWSSRLGISKS